MIIAIDGTAGVGKGTLAKGLAEALNLALLDTGLLYRAVAYEMRSQGISEDDEIGAELTAKELSLETLDHPELRTPAISLMASKISAYRGVRSALIDFQREFAHHPSKGYSGTILDGRDIGTVVCPGATFKFFLTASAQIRAQRRHKEILANKQFIEFEELLRQMELRDLQDATRAIAPLKPAQDAHILDTGFLSPAEVLEKALSIIRVKSI